MSEDDEEEDEEEESEEELLALRRDCCAWGSVAGFSAGENKHTIKTLSHTVSINQLLIDFKVK